MDHVTLKRSGKRPLEFEGELLAARETSPDRANPDWSGETGIWHEAKVYRTAKGGYVLHYVIYTAWQGQEDSYLAHVADSLSDIVTVIEDELAGRVATPLLDRLAGVEDIAERL